MSQIHSRRFDLNLLLVFDAIMEQRSVTQAAARLAVTQAAVSHSLAKFRQLTGDDLFVRSAEGMVPTPRALELAGPIRESLAQVADALETRPFDPTQSVHTFKFAMSEYFAELVLPMLIRRVEVDAPNVDIRIVAPRTATVYEQLEAQEIDFAIGMFRERPRRGSDRFGNVTLLEESYACLLRKGHPLLRARLTLREFIEARHLHLSITGEDMGTLDRALREMQLKRRIALTLGYFIGAPRIIQHSDMVMTVASRMAHLFARQYGLRAVPVPLKLPPSPLRLVWHARFGQHSANRWMRGLLIEIGSKARRRAAR